MHSLNRTEKGLLQGKSPESKRMDFDMLKMTHVWHAIKLKNTSEKFIILFGSLEYLWSLLYLPGF